MSTRERIVVFIPMYNCEKQIPRVVAQFDTATQNIFDELVVLDNNSLDRSRDAAMEALGHLTHLRAGLRRNAENYGLGGSHKVAFDYAVRNGFDYVVILHGDDQGNIHDLLPFLEAGVHRTCDGLFGSRFMPGSRRIGYSLLRTLGNHAFNVLFSLVSGRLLYDLGSGLNLFSVEKLKSRNWLRHANDLTFNYHMILMCADDRWDIRFFPLSWRDDDQMSNVKLVSQAWRTIQILASVVKDRRAFFAADRSGRPNLAYSSSLVFENGGDP